ncbi:ABC transporter substrate-binding protein [Desulfosarcina variabilis]|uniref:ABC transporter substrate-binding protein n=1 Tax=Desulfosarcina variabilis TaxID=2300 RepID=UPI003AFB1E17
MICPPALAKGTVAVEITNAQDQSIRIKTPVRRMAVLPSDTLEVVRILDAADRVVGVNNTIAMKPSFWPDLKTRERIGQPFVPNYEQIVSLWPDLVLAYGWRPGKELEEKLLPLGIQVLRLDFFRPSTLIREIQDLGRLLGKSTRAEAYASWHDDLVTMLKKRLRNQQRRPTVYMEAYADYHASGPGSGGYEMGLLAGGNLIASDFEITNPQISTEFIVSKNPDVIVKMVSHSNAYDNDVPCMLEDVRNNLMQRPGWSYTSAVKTGRVYAISSDVGPGPRGIVGVLYLARCFYPDAFTDIDIRKIHQQYLERFQGIPYKGAYVFPENWHLKIQDKNA